MIADKSNSYSVFPSEMQGDRLDFVFHHPDLDLVREFRRSPRTVQLGSVITAPEYGVSESGLTDGNVGFLNVQHIMPNGEIIFDPPTFVEEYAEQDTLREGDVLIARTGHTLGKAAVITSDFAGYAFGSFCIRFALLPDVDFRNEFIVRFINSQIGQLQILMLKSGSGKYNINSDQIRNIRIPRMRLTDQDSIISRVKLIGAEASVLENKARQIRKSAEWLLPQELGIEILQVKTANYFFKTGAEKQTISYPIFPNEATDRLHYLYFHPRFQVLHEMNEHYRTVSLAEICGEPIVRGEQPEYDEVGTVTVIKTVDLKNGYIDYENTLKVSEEFYDAHPAAHVHKGDILVASTGYVSMGKVDIYDRDEPAMVDGHISIVRVNDGYDPYFIAYFLRSHFGQLQFEKWFTGSSGQIEVQPYDLGGFLVPANDIKGIPPDDQRRIAAAITQQLEEARVLEWRAAAKWREAREEFERMILAKP